MIKIPIIEPCPECGTTPSQINSWTWQIVCPKCGYKGSKGESLEDGIHWWNYSSQKERVAKAYRCPFCGEYSIDFEFKYSSGVKIVCHDCWAESKECSSEEEALKIWNDLSLLKYGDRASEKSPEFS